MHPHWATIAASILILVKGAAGAPAPAPAPEPAPEPAPLLLRHDARLHAPHVNVERAQNMTVCPYVVVHNVREDREPRLIKELKCERGVESAGRGCCDAHRRHRCVELRDQLAVRYPARGAGALAHETVSVGCACLRHEPRPAHHPTPPHV